MKKLILGLLFLLSLSNAFACITNSIEVFTDINALNLQMGLFMSAKYSVIENNYLFYYANNTKDVFIRANNESIVFRSEKSVNWSNILYNELNWLNSINSTNLSINDIVLISESGCCGIFKNGNFSVHRDVCNETFVVPIVNTSLTWIAVLLSFLPTLIVTIYFARNNGKKYLVFVVGGAAWFIALMAREPILTLLEPLNIVLAITVASVLAGVFEEIGRFLLMKYFEYIRKNPLMFGLGWGIAEAFILFTLNIAILLLLNQAIGLNEVFPSAVERIITTGLHVALTMIIFKSLDKKILLFLAIIFHALINIIVALSYFVFGFSAWTGELILFGLTALIGYVAYEVNKK